MRRLLRRIAAVFHKPRLDRELEEELACHVALATEENMSRGMPEEEARRLAYVQLGGLDAARELHRESRGLPVVDTLLQDARESIRLFRREPGLAMFAILIVGLGVGASATVFSVVKALLVEPLPFPEAERLVWIANSNDPPGETVQVNYVRNLAEHGRSFEDVAGYYWFYGEGNGKLTNSGEPARLTYVPVSCNFFPLLGVRPRLGRWFSEQECTVNGPRAAMLGYRMWQRRFASDPSLIGRTLTINDAPATVVGVLPEGFDFASVFAPGTRADFFVPFPMSGETNRMGNTMAVVGRLKPGVSVAAAQSEAVVLSDRERPENKDLNRFRPRVEPLRARVTGGLERGVVVLACAVGLVMLIVCANLSNLLLARNAAREKEIAIRAALGAGRRRLVRQMLTESTMLSSAGAIPGLALAVGGTRLLANLDASIPLLDRVGLDYAALLFAIGMALFTGLAFGLAPALRLSQAGIGDSLKESSRGSTQGAGQGWLRRALVVAEIALTCVLLVGSGLLARSLVRLLDVDLGFRPESALALRVDPPAQYRTGEARGAYFDDVLRRARSAPSIAAAGLTDALPMSSDRSWGIFFAEGKVLTRENAPEAYVRVVSDGYFGAMGIPLRAGRDFRRSDDGKGEPAIIVNESLARRLWPGENAVGRMMQTDFVKRRVVGVVSDVRHVNLEEEAGNEMYLPMRQTGDYSSVTLVARGERGLAEAAAAVRTALRPIDPNMPLNEMRPIGDIVDRSVSPRRLIVLLLGGFAGFALILASLGVYGVISYSASKRRQEIGIRMALGASARQVQGWIVAETLRLVGAGLVLGVAGAMAAAQVMESLLFGVRPTDVVTFGAVAGVLGLVAVFAGYLPARRATRLNPMEALRVD